jgi:hypothetical protein
MARRRQISAFAREKAEQGARANDHGCHDPCSEQHGSRQPRSWLILNVRQKMRLFLSLLVALGAFAGHGISSAPLRRAVLLASVVLGISLLIHGVVLRRRRGQSWNEALAGGEKLMTGSVWLDGALFAGILAVIGVAVCLLFYYA